MTLLSVLLVLSSAGLVACQEGNQEQVTYGFNDKLLSSYYVDETVDIEKTIVLPEGKSYSMVAEYSLNGQIKKYLNVGLTFKPTNLGEVNITVSCDGVDYKASVMIVEQPPTLVNVDKGQYILGETIEISSIANKVTVVPFETPVKVTKVRYAGGEEISLEDQTEYTFNTIGNYEFYFEASNSSGKVDGWVTATVSREITEKEVNDLTNSIKQMDYSTLVQSEEHSENSDWSWKVSATPEGTYGSSKYWISRAFIDFGEVVDLSKKYFEMDVWASEGTYEGGVLIYYSPGSSSQLEWHLCPSTTYNNWQTISTQSDEIRNNPAKTSIKVRGIIVSVLHRQTGEYDKENVYYLFDNLVLKDYRELGENEINDLTNKGVGGTTMGMSYRLDESQKSAGSDWSYKLYTKLPRKASDYPYADFSLGGGNLNMSDYDFSFFVKTNSAYNVSEFKIVTLYLDENKNLTWGTEYTMPIEANSWNYVTSLNFKVKEEKVCSIRVQFNGATTDVRDIVLWIDNFKVIEKSRAETQDYSNSISVNSRNQIAYGMSSDVNGTESSWAWDVTGRHFDYFKVTFDKTYSFSNAYFEMDLKPIKNFGGKVVVQFIAEDGSVKKDWIFDSVPTSSNYVTLSTKDDTTELLANYKAANIYLLAEEIDKEVNVIIDNVNVVSRGYSEYIAVDADAWNITNGTGKKTISLTSFNAGEKYVQYYKEGGYTNEFIDVEIPLNGTKNPDWAFGMRVETSYRYVNVYGKQGFYIRLNDGFFTLYGPTFLGAHCGSYNYPNGMENCTKLRMGVISNNNFVQAFLYFLKSDGSIIGTYTWKNMETDAGPNSGKPIDPKAVKAGSFIIYSLKGEQSEITVTDPFNYVPAPSTFEMSDGNVTWDALYADNYLVSVDGDEFKPQTANSCKVTDEGSHKIKVKAIVNSIESEVATYEFIHSSQAIEVLNANNLSYIPEGANKGTLTFTSPSDSVMGNGGANKGTIIKVGKDLTNNFIKVGFKMTGTSFLANTLGLGGRVNFAQTITNPSLYYYSVLPIEYGGGMKLNASGQNVYIENGASGAQRIVDKANLTFTAGAQYYYVYGLLDDTTGTSDNCDRDYRVYFAILDSNGKVMRAYHWAKSIVEDLTETHQTYFSKAINESGSFMISSCLANVERTITYEILDQASGIALFESDITAPQVSQDGDTVSWATAWASGYEVKVGDDGTFTKTTDTSMKVTQSTNVYVKAYNAHVQSPITTFRAVSLNGVTVANAASSSVTEDASGVNTVTISANSGATNTNAAYFNNVNMQTDKFMKVGFTGVAGTFLDQKLAFGMRRTSLGAHSWVASGYSIQPTPYGSGVVINSNGSTIYANYTDGANPYGGDLVYGTWSNSYTAGTQYYAYVGAVGSYTEASGTTPATDIKYYFAIAEVNGTTETLKFVIEFSYINDVLALKNEKTVYFGKPNASGYLVVWTWMETQRTITYQIVDNTTILDKLS